MGEDRKNVIVVMGVPGSGKSTFAKSLAEHMGYGYISSGDIARRIHNSDDSMGELNSVDWLSPREDDIRQEIAGSIMMASNTVILDGFPRTVAQLEFLYSLEYNVPTIYYIQVPFGVAKKRIKNRGRDDGGSINKRLSSEEKRILQIIVYLFKHKQLTKLYVIDGCLEIKDMTALAIRDIETYSLGL